ncbi:MAG: hypothetical protein IJO93_04970 [Clostridia bacterium]|nr:hypothetical protein [Clostridia bacterium]
MKAIRMFIGIAIILATVMALCPASLAKSHNVEELKFSIDLPDTWTVATRTEFDEKFTKSYFDKDKDAWQRFMKLYDYYLFAAAVGSGDAQYEICVSSYDDFEEKIDYSDLYDFELEMTAKASYKANVNSEGSTTVYSDYTVIKGAETNYIVFNYQDVDTEGNPMYGRLYHTVMNGFAIDFDLNAYEKLSDDYVDVFDAAVASVQYDEIPVPDAPWYELSDRTKKDLIYIALLILAIALVVVIIIFIISKVKERKEFNRAAEEAVRAAAEANADAEPLNDSETETE